MFRVVVGFNKGVENIVSKRLQTAIERYLNDEVFPIGSNFSDGKKNTIVEVTKDAVNTYFERIKDRYSDSDWISEYDRLNILQESGEMKVALSLEIPKSALLKDDEKVLLAQSLLEQSSRDAVEVFNQICIFSDDLAYQSLCNFLMKQNCFTEKHVPYLFMEDKYSDALDIVNNFRFVVDSQLPQKVKFAFFFMLPSLIKMKNVPKVELAKELIAVFITTDNIAKNDKKEMLQFILNFNDVKFFKKYFSSMDTELGFEFFQKFLWRETIMLRYIAKAYLSLSSDPLYDFFIEYLEREYSHENQQILLGLLDFIYENYSQNKAESKKLLLAGSTSRYPTIRKTSYELLFVLDDDLEDIAQRCVHDTAIDVRKILGDVALSNTKYKDLNPERKRKLVQLTIKYRDKLNLTNKQEKRLKTYEN
jgi:hypothetical protein